MKIQQEYRHSVTGDEASDFIKNIHGEIYKEYCLMRLRIIHFKASQKKYTFSWGPPNKKNTKYVIKIMFDEYNPKLAEKLSKKVQCFVKGLHFIPSKAYGGKYEPVTYYLRPDWDYWNKIAKEKP